MFTVSKNLKNMLIIAAILEFVAFLLVANWIGFFRSIVLTCLSSAIGIALLKNCGLTLPQPGYKPPNLKPGLLIAIILLIIPGFISDIIGLLLLVPSFRSLLISLKFLPKFTPPKSQKQAHHKTNNAHGEIIEGECTEETKKTHQETADRSKNKKP